MGARQPEEEAERGQIPAAPGARAGHSLHHIVRADLVELEGRQPHFRPQSCHDQHQDQQHGEVVNGRHGLHPRLNRKQQQPGCPENQPEERHAVWQRLLLVAGSLPPHRRAPDMPQVAARDPQPHEPEGDRRPHPLVPHVGKAVRVRVVAIRSRQHQLRPAQQKEEPAGEGDLQRHQERQPVDEGEGADRDRPHRAPGEFWEVVALHADRHAGDRRPEGVHQVQDLKGPSEHEAAPEERLPEQRPSLRDHLHRDLGDRVTQPLGVPLAAQQ